MLKKLSLSFGALLLMMLIGDAAFAQTTTSPIDVSIFTGQLTLVGGDIVKLFGGIAGVVTIIVAGVLLLGVFRGAAH